MNPIVLDQIVRQQEDIESLRQQLAAALAACKAKDELIRMCAGIQVGYLKEALAIQPDDALASVIERVKEQCAAVIEAQDVDPSFKHRMADAIRTLEIKL